MKLLSLERKPSFRINTLKVKDEKNLLMQLMLAGWQGEALGCGFTIEAGYEAVRDSKYAADGTIYIQNAASWLPVLELDPQPDERILDMCAAPGGKAAHIAALTGNQAELWVNDNSRARLHKMRANFERLGVIPAQTTMYDATQLSRKLTVPRHSCENGNPVRTSQAGFPVKPGMTVQPAQGYFDKILLDAPCSGEGLMNYECDKDFATWSVAHIKRLNTLQKRLISQAWQLLVPGGTLVYSTCTMAPEENEAVVDYLIRHNDDVQVKSIEVKLPNQVKSVLSWQSKTYSPKLNKSLRLTPSPFIEAFFVCALTKTKEESIN